MTLLETFKSKTLLKLAQKALRLTRPHMPSRTLRRDSYAEVVEGFGYVVVPYYWALYVHEGRGAFGPGNPPMFLVWFHNKKNDPRTRGGTRYPRREKDRVRLSKAQWDAGLKENRRRRAKGLVPYMIVRKWQPKHAQANPFFDRALSNFSNEAAPDIKKAFDKLAWSQMIKDTATARMRIFS